jgi:5'-methylthioadenosine phosphorylase
VADVARDTIARGGRDTRVRVGGTYVNMEGPAFSTKAESRVYRGFGFDVIGMTSLGEAKLCKEAEICYQALAMVTDYDCWHETEAPVTVELLIGHLMANVKLSQDLVREIVARMPHERGCACVHALKEAILTQPDAIAPDVKARLAPIIGKYVR